MWVIATCFEVPLNTPRNTLNHMGCSSSYIASNIWEKPIASYISGKQDQNLLYNE